MKRAGTRNIFFLLGLKRYYMTEEFDWKDKMLSLSTSTDYTS